MASRSQGTASSFALGLLLVAGSFFHVALADLSDITATACDDGASCGDMTELEPSELYLLQRKAQVIRKATVETSSLTRDLVKVYTNKSTLPASLHIHQFKDRCPHSRASAFVTAVRSHVVPLTQEQRLAMLSTTQASGLSEAWTRFIIGACCFTVIFAGVAIVVLNIIQTRFARIFGDIIERGVQTVADDVLGLEVTLASKLVDVLKGRVILTDLKIANPPHCKSDSFFQRQRRRYPPELVELCLEAPLGQKDQCRVGFRCHQGC